MALSERERDLSERERALRERQRDLSEREWALSERERALSEREREMDCRIYRALQTGNLTCLRNLLQENGLIFDRFLTEFVSQNPLHIAILHRSLNFAREILPRKPQLAHVLSSQGFSPLRMASANGSADIVQELLPLIVDVSHDRDSKGWTPVHAAAMKGHVNVLAVFNGTRTEWIQDITDRDETVLHLYVKYNNGIDALTTLIGFLGVDNGNEFVNRKDANGNTILHLAAMKKDMEMMTYLITATGVSINATNMNGLTALDVFAMDPGNLADKVMVKELEKKGAERSWEKSTAKTQNELKNVLMVVGTLTATLSFQATLVPPGGLWQDDSNIGFNNTLTNKNHTMGTSILADKEPRLFQIFHALSLLMLYMSLLLILTCTWQVKPVSREKVVSPMLPILLPALVFVSVIICLYSKVHTPKGFPHDIDWQLNAAYLIFFVCSLFASVLVPIINLKTRWHCLRD